MKQSNNDAGQLPSGVEQSAWPILNLQRNRQQSLIEQIVDAISAIVRQRELRIGTKMPSLHQLAKCNGVRAFTVVEVYGTDSQATCRQE